MYNTAMHKFIRVSKAVIINEHGKALLLLRGPTAPSRPSTWDLPGGIVEDGETTLETVRREVLEETGLNINPDSYSPIDKHEDYNYCWTVYEVRITNEQVDISWEHDEYKWVDEEELEELKNIPIFLKKIVQVASKKL